MVTRLHKNLTIDKWSAFPIDRQILMIGCEFSRVTNAPPVGAEAAIRESYERAFELLDLCTEDAKWRPRLRELLRFREHLGELYLQSSPDSHLHQRMYGVLMEWDAVTARLYHDTA
jgi:hypothetical protein